MLTAKTVATAFAATILGVVLVYTQIRIIHDCGILRIMFGAAEWQWFLGYCN